MNKTDDNLGIVPRRVRLLWEIENLYKKFYWFQMENKDLYWGPSSPVSKEIISKEFSNSTNVSLSIPDAISFDEKVFMKFSYHESGRFHIKQTSNGTQEYFDMGQLSLIHNISEPHRFFTLISKAPQYYESYSRNLTKDNTHAIVFSSKIEDINRRRYFEFFISTEGQFKPPMPLLRFKKGYNELQPIVHSLNERFLLVIRHFIIGGMDHWHPDKEVHIFTK